MKQYAMYNVCPKQIIVFRFRVPTMADEAQQLVRAAMERAKLAIAKAKVTQVPKAAAKTAAKTPVGPATVAATRYVMIISAHGCHILT